MAQTGYTPILIYSSTTASQAPAAGSLTNSTLGSELAINITDGKLFYKDNANAIQVIGWKTTPTTAGGTGLTSYTAGDMLYYAAGTVLSKLAIGSSGYYISSSGTAPQWTAPAALTRTNDTNVTLTLGGSASTALLNAASLTLGWTGQLAVTRGGTGLATVAQGDILYGSAADTLSALAKNTTATRYLSNTGSSNNPAWAQVNLANGVTGVLASGNMPNGTILQVVYGATSSVTSVTTGTLTDTGVTVTITPTRSTSTIAVLVGINGIDKSGNTGIILKLLRGTTTIANMEGIAGFNGGAGSQAVGGVSAQIIDAPATTSATTYKVQMASYNGNTVTVNSNGGTSGNTTSFIMAMEIAG